MIHIRVQTRAQLRQGILKDLEEKGEAMMDTHIHVGARKQLIHGHADKEHKVEQGSRVCSHRRAQTPRAAGRTKGMEKGRLDCVLRHSIAREWS